MHSVANLATLQTPFAIFPPKKVPKPYLVSENRRYCCTSTRSCFPSTRTHLSLSLSLCLSAQFLFSTRTHISLSLHVCSVSVQRAHTHLSLSLCTAQFLFSVHTSLSLSLSLHLLSFCSARGREEQSLIQLNTDISCLLL